MEIEWARREDERLIEDQRFSSRRLGDAATKKLRQVMRALEAAENLGQLMENRMFKFKPLRGDRAGQYSMRLTRRDRIIFELADKPDTLRILRVGGHYD